MKEADRKWALQEIKREVAAHYEGHKYLYHTAMVCKCGWEGVRIDTKLGDCPVCRKVVGEKA